MQGYDSVAMDVDVEVGGRDQLFNMMIGRDLMHKMKRKNKFVMTTQLLVDSQGNKIGKTEGNTIALTDPPEKMFGAIMNFPDDVITQGLESLTDVLQEEIESAKNAIKRGRNPLQFKKTLAFELVKQLDGQKTAQKAQEEFESVHQKREKPEDLNIHVKENISVLEAIVTLVSSKSQAKRLLDQGAIEVDGNVQKDAKVKLKSGQVLKVGKKTFAKVGE